MSIRVRTTDGANVESNIFLFDPKQQWVSIGDIEMPLDQFAELATHWLSGGAFGWGEDNSTPECISRSLDYLFCLYKKTPTGWQRKSLDELTKGS